MKNFFKPIDHLAKAKAALDDARQQYLEHLNQESYHRNVANYFADRIDFYSSYIAEHTHEPDNQRDV